LGDLQWNRSTVSFVGQISEFLRDQRHFATTAAKRWKSLEAIVPQTLHSSERGALTYIRHAKLFDDNGLF